MTLEQIELHELIMNAAENDSIQYQQAANNLNLVLHDAAIAGRKTGYFQGYKDAATKYSSLLEEEKTKSKNLLEALEKISISQIPYNIRELSSWEETARHIATEAINQYKKV
mgnify:CR=1 FL=1